MARTANVVATLRGSTLPDETVIIGAHHDAWGFGACDPLAGTILVLESARAFSELAGQGVRPLRSIAFAAWGAEEFDIIGSTEWVESRREELERSAIAYINLDMATMGDNFWAAASPTLKTLIIETSQDVPHCRQPEGGQARSVYGEWLARSGTREKPALEPAIGDLGGGSDHVGFLCHAGIPCVALGSSGARGSSYHSIYDTLAWYRAVVGADYASARLVTGIANAIVATLADADTAHISATALVDDGLAHAASLRELAKSRNLGETGELTDTILDTIIATFRTLRGFAAKADARVAQSPRPTDGADLWALRGIWMSDDGLEGRPWFRNLLAAPERDSGYATSTWPLLREAILDAKADDPDSRNRIMVAADAYLEAQAAMYAALDRLIAPPSPSR